MIVALLFALALVALLAIDISDTTSLANLINAGIEKALMAARIPTLFWPGGPAYSFLRVKDLTAGGAGSGIFSQYGALEAYEVAEGELNESNQAMDPDSTTVTPTEKQVISWITNKALRALSSPNEAATRAQEEADEHVRAHRTKFDKAVMAAFPSLTAGASDTGNAITISDVEAAVLVLKKLMAPKPWIGFLSEQMWNDLVVEGSSPLASAAASGQIGEQLWLEYDVKRFLGITWFVTDNVYDDGTDAYGAILSNRALGATLSQLPQTDVVQNTSAEAVRRRSTMVSSVADWGADVVDANMGVYLQFDYD